MREDAHNADRGAEILTFENDVGRESEVRILSKEQIAEGNIGKIFRCHVRVSSGQRQKDRTFVIKQFEWDQALDPSQRASDRAYFERRAKTTFDGFTMVKNAGLPTWKTCRIAKQKPVIILSDGEVDRSIIFSHNRSTSKSELERRKLFKTSIANPEETVATLMAIATRAQEQGVYIPADAWLFRAVPSQGRLRNSIELSGFIGDFDHVRETIDSDTAQSQIAGIIYALNSSLAGLPISNRRELLMLLAKHANTHDLPIFLQ